ncbi:4789_t:CDS:2 [Rhizophagus irregularis]|nr:4789_t:CDS:2 [Rhizophagus irregularis]
MSQHEVVEKLETGFKKFNDKFTNLLEENQRIKQHNKNLQEKNQEISRTNLELNEKNQEISRTNLELNKKYQEISRNNSKLIEENEKILHIRIVVGLDFGVTYSGFSYCHVNNQNICTNCEWPGETSSSKTNTVLQYDDEYINVLCWGAEALRVRPKRKNRKQNSKPVELFKLYLGDLPDNLKPKLPIDYKKAITDYLREIGKTFMFVDCGKCTTDLTTRKLLVENRLDKVTARIRDFCGSKLINEEFIKFLRERLGTCAIDLLKENNYKQLQYMVKNFYQHISIFTGDDKAFQYELDIEVAPILLQYVSEEIKETMEEIDWVIEIKYNDIKKIFDPVVDRIIRLIHIQLLNNKENCSTIFLTGDFCVNKYLQNRIKNEFSHQVKDILVPALPEAAVARGAVIYGLSTMYDRLKCVISSRLLKYTYGVQYYWKSSDDLTHDGKNCKFKTLVKRDTEITPDQTFSFNFKPESKQISESFAIYYTQKHNIEGYCDEPGVNRLGILNIDLSDVQLDCRSIIFGLTFGKDEIIALARNELNRQEHMATFCYPDDDF